MVASSPRNPHGVTVVGLLFLVAGAAAYFDLVQAHAVLGVNAFILEQVERILRAAEAGERAGLLTALGQPATGAAPTGCAPGKP